MNKRTVYTAADATLSDDAVYRYHLTREWSLRAPRRRVAFVMLNPSTADGRKDDATIRRCVGFARSWGFDALDVVNLFALRSRSPVALTKAADPVGPDNVATLERVFARADLVVAAWGVNVPRVFHDAAATFGATIRSAYEAQVLALTKHGHPQHPLFVPASVVPARWVA